MQIILIILILVLILSGLMVFRISRKRKKQEIFPAQKKLVLELIRELKTSRIDIILSDRSGEKHSATLNLFEARFFLESKKELALEKYDELPLFFSDEVSQVINLKKFINNPVFPNEILEELKDFHNESFKPVRPDIPYFIIITDITTPDQNGEYPLEGLFKGSGEAFSSWLNFKEGADNLNFVIEQWIKENERHVDSELYAEFL